LAPSGYATANLSNGGERIALLGPNGETLQDFVYDDVAPWPTAPDGFGSSLEIIDPLGDPTNAANWRASTELGGSPGTDGSVPPLPGDYDRNGTVEQADLIPWRSSYGLSVIAGASADGNHDGTVGAGDYVIWRKNLGQTQSTASSLTAVNSAAEANPTAESPSAAAENATTIDDASTTRLGHVVLADIGLGASTEPATPALSISAAVPAVLTRQVDSRNARSANPKHTDSINSPSPEATSADSASSDTTPDSACDFASDVWADDDWVDTLALPWLLDLSSL
jgi:hypothetical protein